MGIALVAAGVILIAFGMVWKLSNDYQQSLKQILAESAKERALLEDRIMAMADKSGEQLSIFKGLTDPSENDVVYVDEEKELELEVGDAHSTAP